MEGDSETMSAANEASGFEADQLASRSEIDIDIIPENRSSTDDHHKMDIDVETDNTPIINTALTAIYDPSSTDLPVITPTSSISNLDTRSEVVVVDLDSGSNVDESSQSKRSIAFPSLHPTIDRGVVNRMRGSSEGYTIRKGTPSLSGLETTSNPGTGSNGREEGGSTSEKNRMMQAKQKKKRKRKGWKGYAVIDADGNVIESAGEEEDSPAPPGLEGSGGIDAEKRSEAEIPRSRGELFDINQEQT